MWHWMKFPLCLRSVCVCVSVYLWRWPQRPMHRILPGFMHHCERLAIGWWSVQSPPPGALPEPLPSSQWHTHTVGHEGLSSKQWGVGEKLYCLRCVHRNAQTHDKLIKGHDEGQLSKSQRKAGLDTECKKNSSGKSHQTNMTLICIRTVSKVVCFGFSKKRIIFYSF